MANWGVWLEAQNRLAGISDAVPRLKTTETYAKIKESGLETVKWEEFDPKNDDDIQQMLASTRRFIEKRKPCLFIRDPRKKELKKEYLFDVNDFSQVLDWAAKNKNAILDYSYLVTTQIDNHGPGFVGNVFSDGKGSLFCETLHRPGISNQRELSQPKEDIGRYLDHFVAEEFTLRNADGRYLTRENIEEIMNLYAHRKGYFEFVKGIQHGRIGTYTIGFEDLRYPKELSEALTLDLETRCNATHLRSS